MTDTDSNLSVPSCETITQEIPLEAYGDVDVGIYLEADEVGMI